MLYNKAQAESKRVLTVQYKVMGKVKQVSWLVTAIMLPFVFMLLLIILLTTDNNIDVDIVSTCVCGFIAVLCAEVAIVWKLIE